MNILLHPIVKCGHSIYVEINMGLHLQVYSAKNVQVFDKMIGDVSIKHNTLGKKIISRFTVFTVLNIKKIWSENNVIQHEQHTFVVVVHMLTKSR